MAWEKRPSGRYYYHPRRVGGRVRKFYLGRGDEAKLMAERVARERATRAVEREVVRSERARLEPLEHIMSSLDAGCGLLVAAVLTAAGYHRHDRGAWRRKRVAKAA